MEWSWHLLVAIGGLAFLFGVGVLVYFLKKMNAVSSRNSEDHVAARLGQMADFQAASQAQISEVLRDQERAIAKTVEEKMRELGKVVHERLHDSTSQQQKSLSDLRERLAVIDAAQKNISQLSSQVVSLQDILANKQARGAFGEVQLKDIVSQALPPSAYDFQVKLDNGKIADCLIHLPLPPGPIAIDAKFPLESYRIYVDAADKAAKVTAGRTFDKDVRYHINAIAQKYIRPGETAESALLFLPSEAIYSEIHSNFQGVLEESYRKRVWIVSPTTLMATLNTVRAILRDAKLREQADLLQKELAILLEDVFRLDDRVNKLETHFGQASKDIDEIKTSTRKIRTRGDKMLAVELEKDEAEAEIGAKAQVKTEVKTEAENAAVIPIQRNNETRKIFD